MYAKVFGCSARFLTCWHAIKRSAQRRSIRYDGSASSVLMMSERPRLERWLAWQQVVVGLLVAVSAVLHLWVHWPALLGRDAWLERAAAQHTARAFGMIALALLAVHVGMVLLMRRRAGARLDRFQLATGGVFALFLGYHLSQVWPRPDGSAATLLRSYQRLWDQLGQPFALGVYVLGCAAFAAWFAHAVWRVLEPHLPSPLRAALPYAVGLAGFALFASYLQLIARFASGEPLLPSFEPSASERDSRADLPLQSRDAPHARGVDQHVP